MFDGKSTYLATITTTGKNIEPIVQGLIFESSSPASARVYLALLLKKMRQQAQPSYEIVGEFQSIPFAEFAEMAAAIQAEDERKKREN